MMDRVVELLQQRAKAQRVALPSETESLIDAGVLDSFGLLEFLTTIEEEFDLKIPDADLIPANFATIQKICDYVNCHVGV